MKTFFKYDFYVQMAVLLVIGCIVLADLTLRNSELLILFYLGVGISQLISYLIRCSYSYKKSLLFKIYGYLILPVYLSFLVLLLFGNNNMIAMVFLVFPVLAFFYSPVMAVLYVIECYRQMQKYFPVYNRFKSIKNERSIIQNIHENSF
ncbi:hypothetical protein [Chryseobacterium sp. CT-SW4]|uniref:hypothetical protein n=1 Tax=Chryseobacterium sp. SW-1 TaxID=3157343 RepID=UPI003B027FEA